MIGLNLTKFYYKTEIAYVANKSKLKQPLQYLQNYKNIMTQIYIIYVSFKLFKC